MILDLEADHLATKWLLRIRQLGATVVDTITLRMAVIEEARDLANGVTVQRVEEAARRNSHGNQADLDGAEGKQEEGEEGEMRQKRWDGVFGWCVRRDVRTTAPLSLFLLGRDVGEVKVIVVLLVDVALLVLRHCLLHVL